MKRKRLTLFVGHYGSGKTNIAVNYAVKLKEEGLNVTIADLDIVNPYFRTKDSEDFFKEKGIGFICSEYANSNLDVPALPSETYGIFENKDSYGVLDIGGDDRGAYALGRFTPLLKDENNYEMIFVLNFYRPLTSTPEDAFTVLKEIENACGIKVTGVVNNSNLGKETDVNTVADTFKLTEEFLKLSNLPLLYTSVNEDICEKLRENYPNYDFFPLSLQKKLF